MTEVISLKVRIIIIMRILLDNSQLCNELKSFTQINKTDTLFQIPYYNESYCM